MECWPEVVAVLAEHCEVRTKLSEGQYCPVRLEQARLVNSLLYSTRLLICFSFTTHFRSLEFTWLPARDDASNSERTSYQDIQTSYKSKLRLSFLVWKPNCRDTIHHIRTVLTESATGLESPISIASDIEHLLRIDARQSAERLSHDLHFDICFLFDVFKLEYEGFLVKYNSVKKTGNCC